jgi:hypothetical protein
LAAPPLTTIQDVLYKADGTRFNGTISISWKSFQAVDKSDIIRQTTTVKVVDGNLRVQLVPTTTSTPPESYQVTYSSDGRIQFQERWAVPSSATPLRIRDVRVVGAPLTAGSDTGSGGTTGPVNESDVVGLIADLGARPLKSPNFAAGRVAVVDPTGMLASVSGDPSDCVHVDGSTGPCSDASGVGPSFVDSESLSGIVDGANAAFGISAVPSPAGSLSVYRNGILQKIAQDYTLTGNTVQFVAADVPQPGDTLLASYRTAAPSGGTPAPYTSPQVLCSGTGGSTSAAALSNIGICQIPGGLLLPGDRVAIVFATAHTGTGGGFSVEVRWGGTVMLHRDGAAGDVLVTGRAEASIQPAGAQLSSESWGTILPFAVSVGTASDSLNDLAISFNGMVGQAADSVSLTHFSVVRVP